MTVAELREKLAGFDGALEVVVAVHWPDGVNGYESVEYAGGERVRAPSEAEPFGVEFQQAAPGHGREVVALDGDSSCWLFGSVGA